jgi:hypothetical protein
MSVFTEVVDMHAIEATDFLTWDCPINSCHFENCDEVIRDHKLYWFICGSCAQAFRPEDISIRVNE